MRSLCCKNKPSASLTDNHLVLSFPDAITPVVWMMDIDKSNQFFIRVEKDESGVFILQKASGPKQNIEIEDIAFYSDQKKAIKAMTHIGQVLDSGKKQGQKSSSWFGWIMRVAFQAIITLIAIALVITVLGFATGILKWRDNATSDTVQQTENNAPAPVVESNPNAVGVPLSADDFLEQNGRTGLPF